MTDIVGRVARTMFISDGVCSEHDWGNANEVVRVYWRNRARAALAAMLEAVGEPVAWRYDAKDGSVQHSRERWNDDHTWTETPLYSLAALREGL